jgi:hypothetical protein
MKINLTQPSPQGEGSPLLLEEKGPGVEVQSTRKKLSPLLLEEKGPGVEVLKVRT